MQRLKGRVAFVTGGSSGVGLGICKVFAAAGMKVVLGYRDEDHLTQAMDYFRGRPNAVVHPIRLDVTDRTAFKAAADEAERVFGKIHVLCNNAGVSVAGPMDQATYDDWDWVLDVNLGGVVNGIVSVLPRIEAHGEGGHVVNVASTMSFLASFESGLYTTSKFAVRGLTESLRHGLAYKNIGVSLVCPGFFVKSNIHTAARRRPAKYAETGYPVSEEFMEQMDRIQDAGADPVDVGKRVLRGMLRNELYIFPMPMYKPELEATNQRILSAVPNEEMHPFIEAGDAFRRSRQDEGEAKARSLGDAELADLDIEV